MAVLDAALIAACSGYSSIDGEVTDNDAAARFLVPKQGLSEVTVTVPDGFCQVLIRGTVTYQHSGQPPASKWRPAALSPTAATAERMTAERLPRPRPVTTDSQGRFALYVPYHGEFFIAPSPVEPCGHAAIDFHRVELTMNRADIFGVTLAIPADLCSSN